MDVLRRELDRIYASQRLGDEELGRAPVEDCKGLAASVAAALGGCAVVTDAARDRCYLYAGPLGELLGMGMTGARCREICSSDEDVLYERMHPADLVEKRMLEYEYFRFVDPLPPAEKTLWRAVCRVRLRDREGRYVLLDNTTRVLRPSPAGKIWLILCCYDLSPVQETRVEGIGARMLHTRSGQVRALSLTQRKGRILTAREKEILRLIRHGCLSKQIADALGISLNTVNRHRQNILSKLSVANSVEAVTAALEMGLL